MIFAVLAPVEKCGASGLAPSESVAQNGCRVLRQRVDRIEGDAPAFLRSFDAPDGTEPTDAPLRTAAFVYDESLAAIALLACDDRAQAARIAEALRRVAEHDARLRNTYRAGTAKDVPLPNGWWDAAASRWVEDRDQDGTSTGNVAWAGSACWRFSSRSMTRNGRMRRRSSAIGSWRTHRIARRVHGGIDGFDAEPVRVKWKSTEHNIDAEALFRRLSDDGVPGDWKPVESCAQRFILTQWDATSGHFFIGTLADGATPNRDSLGAGCTGVAAAAARCAARMAPVPGIHRTRTRRAWRVRFQRRSRRRLDRRYRTGRIGLSPAWDDSPTRNRSSPPSMRSFPQVEWYTPRASRAFPPDCRPGQAASISTTSTCRISPPRHGRYSPRQAITLTRNDSLMHLANLIRCALPLGRGNHARTAPDIVVRDVCLP